MKNSIDWIALQSKGRRWRVCFHNSCCCEVDDIQRYSLTGEKEKEFIDFKSPSSRIYRAVPRLCKIELFHFFRIEFLNTSFFPLNWKTGDIIVSLRVYIYSPHIKRCYAREWRHYHPYFVCGYVYRWLSENEVGDVVSLLLYFDAAVGHHASSFLSLRAKHTFHYEKRLLSFRPFRIHGMCVCVFFFSFVLSESELKRQRKPSCLRVLSILLFYYSACVHTIFFFSLLLLWPSSSSSPSIDFAFGFHFSSTILPCVAIHFRIFRSSGRRFVPIEKKKIWIYAWMVFIHAFCFFSAAMVVVVYHFIIL